jgi:hypothetical protein
MQTRWSGLIEERNGNHRHLLLLRLHGGRSERGEGFVNALDEIGDITHRYGIVGDMRGNDVCRKFNQLFVRHSKLLLGDAQPT